jgi:16S rRNA (guanine966-N2)-methyltransferase
MSSLGRKRGPQKARGAPPGRIRIISGSRRGRWIVVQAGDEVRPTSGRVREAIFDVLGPVGGLRVLDLFAGSGAMGLEALSRGCADCVFVESGRLVVETLRSNIETLQFEDVSRVMAVDYREAVSRLMAEAGSFDLLFVDPPYRMLPEVEQGLEPFLSKLLGEEGVVVVEGPKACSVESFGDVAFDRFYGDTRVTITTMRSNAQ